jgi:alkylated DNA repair protein (DNA oxidative demethylase)
MRVLRMPESLAERTVVHRLSPEEQAEWADDVRHVCEASPLVRPTTPGGLPMRVRVTAAGRLGWAGGPGGYRYDSTDSRGNPWPSLPERWTELADAVAGLQPWDSAIVNWYETGASLGWHVDRDEADTSRPIVTVSLGDSCSWAVRRETPEQYIARKYGDERDRPLSKPSRVVLESGDVTLLAGPNRGLCHSVERIIAAPMFTPLRGPGRVSVTIRVAGTL